MNLIDQIRNENKLDHKEMMKALGVSKAYYSMLRRGLRPISKELAARLNRQFRVPYEVSFCPTVHKLDTEGIGSSHPSKS